MLSTWPLAHRAIGWLTVGLLAPLVGLYLLRLFRHFRTPKGCPDGIGRCSGLDSA